MFTIYKPKFNHLLIIAASLIAQNTQANGDLNPLKDSIYSQVQIIPNLPEFKEPINNPTSPAKQWFEKISLGGYVQFRYNRLFETNPNLKCEQCDRSIGENGGFFIRRNRLRVAGQIHPRLYMYIQYDFASAPSATAQHYGQIRDAYFDLGLDDDNEFRLRFGQSKTPYGFIRIV